VNQAERLRVKARNNPPFASAAAKGGGRGEGKTGGCGLPALTSEILIHRKAIWNLFVERRGGDPIQLAWMVKEIDG
jgi:hypothetical protein